MDDIAIVELFTKRAEEALKELANKYNGLCYSISKAILKNTSDVEECVNDTYLKVWDSIPPEQPSSLSAYVGKIARNTALDRYSYNHSLKRGGENLIFDELDECIPSSTSVEASVDANSLSEFINSFLGTLDTEKRVVFMRRYWFGDSISDISSRCGISESKIKSMLMRIRKQLATALRKDGLV